MRKSKGADHFDMLPFIAILMCTLGTLLLVTLSTAAIHLGPGAGEEWISSQDPGRRLKRPILFQWDGSILTVQKGREILRFEIPIEMYLQSPDGSSAEKDARDRMEAGFSRLDSEVLDDMERNSGTYYALFALRPSGFHSFQSVKRKIQGRNISVGKEPIAQGKPVKLAPEGGIP